MDLLTDLLKQAGMHRRLLDQRQLPAHTALQFPCDKSIGLHVVTQGRLHLHAPTLPAPLLLGAGDIALMGRGCTHLLSTQADAQALQVASVLDAADAPPAGPEGPRVISGAYQLWNTPLHPFFAELPAWFVLRADSLPRMGPLALAVSLLDDELQQADLGAELALHGLMDLVFVRLVREVLARQGSSAAGWGQAVRDPQVRRAVDLLHGDPAHPWTLDELARQAGLSRTGLAERFRSAMGDTPLNYLRTLRMQKAMQLLAETERKLEDVAAAVGYQDAFGFSKVFKRTVGLTPKAFRQQDQAQRDTPWRFSAA